MLTNVCIINLSNFLLLTSWFFARDLGTNMQGLKKIA